jgi:glycosyltransferase involved in cell wall biosynthesis
MLRRADLIYVHSLGLPLAGGTAPRIIKVVGDPAWERAIRRAWIPATTHVDKFQQQHFGALVEWQKRQRAREVQAAWRVVVPSEYLRRMVQGWGVAPDKIHLIYNALPPEPESNELSQAAARAQLGLDERPLLLTAARLWHWKGVDHIISALEQVPELRLIVAGDGPTRARLEAQAGPLGERVRFLGQIGREALAVYMKAADYFVLYSGYEGLSHSILESLRAGTPVIASDQGGNPEAIEHDFNGLLVPYVDVDALADTLRSAFTAGKRDELAPNTSTGLSRFTFSRMVTQTDGVLKDCLDRH